MRIYVYIYIYMYMYIDKTHRQLPNAFAFFVGPGRDHVGSRRPYWAPYGPTCAPIISAQVPVFFFYYTIQGFGPACSYMTEMVPIRSHWTNPSETSTGGVICRSRASPKVFVLVVVWFIVWFYFGLFALL